MNESCQHDCVYLHNENRAHQSGSSGHISNGFGFQFMYFLFMGS